MNLFNSSASFLFNSSPEAGHFIPYPNTWVKLRDSLSAYSFEEALLLCEEPDGRWVAWIPDFGETMLHRHQFTAPL